MSVHLPSRRLIIVLLTGCLFADARAQDDSIRSAIIGSALTESQALRVCRRLTDEAGGRLTGTEENRRGLEILAGELQSAGISVRGESFNFPGWIRGEDQVTIISPFRRPLRVAALGYTDSIPSFSAGVVYAGQGSAEEFASVPSKNAIALVSQKTPPGAEPLLRGEIIEIAARNGALAVLFANDKPGGLLLCGVANFQGKPASVPAFSITYEEGDWLRRLLEAGIPVTAGVTTRSRCRVLPSANLVARIPGTSGRTLVLGAHVDGWDIGQGAQDNAIGSAILFEAARLLQKFSPVNSMTIECVWFNGEELGLWGSNEYIRLHLKDSLAAMLNLDMTGSPVGFNAGGFDEIIPLLESVVQMLDGFDLRKEVDNSPGTNSDHQPFLLQGIPAINVSGHLKSEDVRFYHDFADTFDKVNPRGLAEASAVVAVLAREMANAGQGALRRKTREETIVLLRSAGIEKTLKRQKGWPFD